MWLWLIVYQVRMRHKQNLEPAQETSQSSRSIVLREFRQVPKFINVPTLLIK